MTVERIVIDTSILISAALSGAGKPALVVDHAVLQCELLFSQATFDELATRLVRPKFDRYIAQADRQVYLDKIRAAATWITITGALVACRDPDDDKIVETAVVGQADCVVTGDKDLLTLHPYRGVAILTAAEFLQLL